MRRALLCSILLATASCDRVFGLTPSIGSGSNVDAAVDSDGPLPVDGRPVPPPCANGPSSGHDEDLDNIDDACDLCPDNPDQTIGDVDHDGIGDVCDPLPEKGCTRRVLFAGFGGVNASITIPAAGWSLSNDDLVADGTSGFAHVVFPGTFKSVAVRVAARITNGSGAVFVGTDLSFDAMGATGEQCVYFAAQVISDSVVLGYYDHDAAPNDPPRQMPAPPLLTAPLEAVFDVRSLDMSKKHQCFVQPLFSTPIEHAYGSQTFMGERRVGLSVGTQPETFHWVDVIDLSTCNI